jgi:transcriptional regulator with XRE-family HTH domain
MEIDRIVESPESNRENPGTPLGPPVESQIASEKSDSRESFQRRGVRRAKSSLRLKYEAETHVIERKLGDLEAIREKLGLTQRKMAQLLLVDPSAWTRWTKGGDEAPPHIYRMLQWYLALEEKYPALDVNFWLNTVTQVTEKSERIDRRQIQNEIESAIRAEIGSELRRFIAWMALTATLAGCAIGFSVAFLIR